MVCRQSCWNPELSLLYQMIDASDPPKIAQCLHQVYFCGSSGRVYCDLCQDFVLCLNFRLHLLEFSCHARWKAKSTSSVYFRRCYFSFCFWWFYPKLKSALPQLAKLLELCLQIFDTNLMKIKRNSVKILPLQMSFSSISPIALSWDFYRYLMC